MNDKISNPKRLKAARALMGLSQAELGRLCGISQGLVSQHESGTKNIGPLSAKRYEKGTEGLLKKEFLCPEIFA